MADSQTISTKADRSRGLKIVAILEAAKGVVATVMGICFLFLLGSNLSDSAQRVLDFLHINSTDKYPQLILAEADKLTGSHMALFASFAFFYAAVRFTEVYGLWHGRRWAEWFAAISCAIYIPFELYELSHYVNWLTVGTLVINVIIVIYMLSMLSSSRDKPRAN